jgi:hypothetical protein
MEKVTQKSALAALIAFAKENGLNNEAVLTAEKKLDSMSKVSAPKTTKAKVANLEKLTELLNVAEPGQIITTAWVTEHVKYCMTSQAAAAVIKVGIEEGKLERIPKEKSNAKQTYRVL